jgi:hypothetical protein
METARQLIIVVSVELHLRYLGIRKGGDSFLIMPAFEISEAHQLGENIVRFGKISARRRRASKWAIPI